MQSEAVVKLIEYIKNEIVKVQEEITKMQNGKITKKISEKEKLRESKKKLEKMKQLIDICTTNRVHLGFSDYSKKINVIMASNLNLSEKMECICYLFNLNYDFYTNEENISRYKNHLEINSANFYFRKERYLRLRNVIFEDNTIGSLKDFDYKVITDFVDIGFSEEMAGRMLDIALRNYEHQITKNI